MACDGVSSRLQNEERGKDYRENFIAGQTVGERSRVEVYLFGKFAGSGGEYGKYFLSPMRGGCH